MSTNIQIDTNTHDNTFFSDRYARRRFPPWLFWCVPVAIIIVIVSVFLWLFAWQPPAGFPKDAYVTVPNGATIGGTAKQLALRNLIRSSLWFRAWSAILGGARGLKAGDYFFDEPLSVPFLAWRMTHSVFALELVSVTIPEGFNNREIAVRLAEKLMRFDAGQFLHQAKEKEGYLFPDTYRFLPNEKSERTIVAMEANFKRRVKPLERDIAAFGRPLSEVLIMASLIEEEARTEETRRTVSGILWKRLDKGMPLQVDAVFPYIFGDQPYDLTDGDLLVDSLYNTYKYAGLPPSPISNPGLAAISAAVTPVTTPYWYYLSDRNGNMHYAVTHDEHLVNRAKYLNK